MSLERARPMRGRVGVDGARVSMSVSVMALVDWPCWDWGEETWTLMEEADSTESERSGTRELLDQMSSWVTDSSSEVSTGVNWPVKGEKAETLLKREFGRDRGGERMAKVVGRLVTLSEEGLLMSFSDLFLLCF